jgi:hypothetical protein
MFAIATLISAALFLPVVPAVDCPFSGLTAVAFGTGTGVCSTSTLQATFGGADCKLTLDYAPDEISCGNTFLTHHLLIVGVESIPAGVAVGAQFLPDSRLYVVPLVLVGPLAGGSSTFTLPNAPALIGVPFYVQTAPTFVTTISNPPDVETGLSSALQLTLQ